MGRLPNRSLYRCVLQFWWKNQYWMTSTTCIHLKVSPCWANSRMLMFILFEISDLELLISAFDDLKPVTHILVADITSKKGMKLLHEGIRYLVYSCWISWYFNVSFFLHDKLIGALFRKSCIMPCTPLSQIKFNVPPTSSLNYFLFSYTRIVCKKKFIELDVTLSSPQLIILNLMSLSDSSQAFNRIDGKIDTAAASFFHSSALLMVKSMFFLMYPWDLSLLHIGL